MNNLERADVLQGHLENAVASFAYLLECTLATYDSLCLSKRSSQLEIRRHEALVLKAFGCMVRELCILAPTQEQQLRGQVQPGGATPRVWELVDYVREGHTTEAACAKYFEEHRASSDPGSRCKARLIKT